METTTSAPRAILRAKLLSAQRWASAAATALSSPGCAKCAVTLPAKLRASLRHDQAMTIMNVTGTTHAIEIDAALAVGRRARRRCACSGLISSAVRKPRTQAAPLPPNASDSEHQREVVKFAFGRSPPLAAQTAPGYCRFPPQIRRVIVTGFCNSTKILDAPPKSRRRADSVSASTGAGYQSCPRWSGCLREAVARWPWMAIGMGADGMTSQSVRGGVAHARMTSRRGPATQPSGAC